MNWWARGSGNTTKQMQDAPLGSIYIWPNSNLHYPRELARHLGRTDLQIKSLAFISHQNIRARRGIKITLDHAARPQREQWDAWQDYLARNP